MKRKRHEHQATQFGSSIAEKVNLMKVAHFSTFTHGGAAEAAKRLQQGLLQCGADSQFFHGADQNSQTNDPTFRTFETRPTTKNMITQHWSRRLPRYHWRKHIEKRPKEFELFTSARLFAPTTFDFRSLQTDVINLHWVSYLIDYASFFRSIPRKTPITWTLHDMNPMTGGCHYSNGCERFRNRCGNCNQLSNPARNDASTDSFRLKQRALKGRNLHIVTPSRWLAKLALQSPIFPRQTTFSVIPYGFDTDGFSPMNKIAAKKELGLDPDKSIILFGAEKIQNRRKGFHFLIEALEKINHDPATVCLLFGGGSLPRDLVNRMPKTIETGFLKTTKEKQLVYSAADCFVMPSLEDNQPQTGLEAMACGTPVVAFNAGGIPEYVLDGVTGLLAPVGDSHQLASQIQHLLDDPLLAGRLGKEARKMIEQEHDLKRQAEKYIAHYEKILGKSALSDSVHKAA